MTHEPTPIETHYNGYRFRSRTEARWAVVFDKLELPWEYEPEGFDLGTAGWYLPDFRLHLLWIEVKPPNVIRPLADLIVREPLGRAHIDASAPHPDWAPLVKPIALVAHLQATCFVVGGINAGNEVLCLDPDRGDVAATARTVESFARTPLAWKITGGDPTRLTAVAQLALHAARSARFERGSP